MNTNRTCKGEQDKQSLQGKQQKWGGGEDQCVFYRVYKPGSAKLLAI